MNMNICSFWITDLPESLPSPNPHKKLFPRYPPSALTTAAPLTPTKSLSVKKANPDKQSSPLNQGIPEPSISSEGLLLEGRLCAVSLCDSLKTLRLKRQHACPRSNLLTIMLLGRHHNLYLYLHMPAVNMK